MGSPNFADAQGKLLESMLAAQKTVRDNMRNFLEAMNVPTREDIVRLGELITGLEQKIDQVDDRLGAIEHELRRSSARRAAPSARSRARPPGNP